MGRTWSRERGEAEVDGEGCGKMNTSGSDTRTGTETLKDNGVVKGYMYGGFQLEGCDILRCDEGRGKQLLYLKILLSPIKFTGG